MAEGRMARRMRGVRLAIGSLGVVVSLSVLAGAAVAAPLTSFGSEGAGAGQFEEARGIAVNQETGDVYLADKNHERIDEFAGEGAFLRAWGWGVADGSSEAPQTCTQTCFGGLRGSGAGQLNGPEGVAVDNDPLSLSHGDVYVIDSGNSRVEKYDAEGRFLLMFGGHVNKNGSDVCLAGEECQAGTSGKGEAEFDFPRSIAVGSTGSVYVGDDGRVQKFSSGGALDGQMAVGGSRAVNSLAVAGGDIYLIGGAASGVREYEALGGAEVGTLDASGQPRQVALAAGGEVFVEDDTTHIPHILQYASSGAQVASFPRPGAEEECRLEELEGSPSCLLLSQGLALAAPPAERLYELGEKAVWVGTPPAPGPLITAESGEAGVPASTATLKATVNPEGGETTYHFEYGTTKSYGASTPAETLPASFEEAQVSASPSEVEPGSTYHLRLVATAGGHTTRGPDTTVTTYPAARIDSLSVSNVTATGATLHAQIDPLGEQTTYRLLVEGGAGRELAVEAHLPAGTGDVPVEVRVSGLAAGAGYSYLVVATNALGSAESAEPFTTQGAAGGFVLLDGRHYEQVSSVNKQGALIEPIYEEGALVQAAADGDAITYASFSATESAPEAEPAPELAQSISRRSAPGVWASRDIATAKESMLGLKVGRLDEYTLFSTSLSSAIVEPLDPKPLSPYATERTPYLREEASCAPPTAGCFVPLVTAAAGHEDVPPGTQFGGADNGTGGELSKLAVTLEGASPDLAHVLLASEVPLEAGATGAGLYEWEHGRLSPVSLLPGGGVAKCPKLGDKGRDHNVRDAVSASGARVIWEEDNGPGCLAHHLYLRDTVAGSTVQLDAVQQGATGKEAASQPVYRTASSEVSTVFFTDTIQLTPSATARPSQPDLYACEILESRGRPECVLTDTTVPLNAGEHADVQGVIGASASGSTVYLVARGVLTAQPDAAGETASRGAENLYELRREEPGHWHASLIGVLSGEDERDWEGSAASGGLSGMTSRVSPNGQWLAFMSERSLSGYDSRDLETGEPVEEVFLYSAASRRLVCASCDPTGARPDGTVIEGTKKSLPLVEQVDGWKGHRLAAVLPSWTPFKLDAALYQSRYLSDEGRVFFDGYDPLVPADANGTWDVYEYEPGGTGSCTTATSTAAALYSQDERGCIGLVSAGTSPDESAFLDASESGEDVFFLTAAKLVSQDTDNAYDVYDAHVCTAAAPCAAAPVQQTQACESASACKGGAGAAASVLSAPATLLPSGDGNLVAKLGGRASTPKRLRPGKSRKRVCRAKARRIKQARRRRRALALCARHKRARGALSRRRRRAGDPPRRRAGARRRAARRATHRRAARRD